MLPFVYSALSSGARAGELLSLEWKDVDLAKGVAIIHTSKNSEGPEALHPGQGARLLKAYAKVRHLGSPGVFLLNSGAPLTHQLRQAVPRRAGDSKDHGLSVPRPQAYRGVVPGAERRHAAGNPAGARTPHPGHGDAIRAPDGDPRRGRCGSCHESPAGGQVMINRHFYKFSEVVQRLGTDGETLRQAVALGKASVFLEFNREDARWMCGDDNEARKSDPYCSWSIDRTNVLFDEDRFPTNTSSEVAPCKLSGWFRVSGTRHAMQHGRASSPPG